MQIHKQPLCALPLCYAVSHIQQDGREKYLLATDDTGPCYAIDCESLQRETVWSEPGGTMSLVPLPGTNGDFLAVQRFLPGFSAERAEIVHVSRRGGEWRVRPWLALPYVHRFDILERGGVAYLLFCTLCREKRSEDDWSSPGELLAMELPADFSAPPPRPVSIAGGMTRNHGYWRVRETGWSRCLTACDQGVFDVRPPERRGMPWSVRRILPGAVSDIALCDIGRRGAPAIAALKPFHGDSFVIYEQADGETYQPAYRYPGKMGFCHVVWGGMLRGKPVFLGGCRAENKELFLVRREGGEWVADIVEKGCGPSNVLVLPGKRQDRILVANRECGEAAVFLVED